MNQINRSHHHIWYSSNWNALPRFEYIIGLRQKALELARFSLADFFLPIDADVFLTNPVRYICIDFDKIMILYGNENDDGDKLEQDTLNELIASSTDGSRLVVAPMLPSTGLYRFLIIIIVIVIIIIIIIFIIIIIMIFIIIIITSSI